jgi:Adenylosuccinate lyase
MLEFFSRKLPVSRMQRDLTDSTILRNVGCAFSYSMIGFNSIMEGFGKLEINKKKIDEELEENFNVISEGLQTRMKVLGIEESYEKMKEITRKKCDTKKELINFIDTNPFSPDEKKYLKTITPFNYTGIYKL